LNSVAFLGIDGGTLRETGISWSLSARAGGWRFLRPNVSRDCETQDRA
jgi:hypothetical protein